TAGGRGPHHRGGGAHTRHRARDPELRAGGEGGTFSHGHQRVVDQGGGRVPGNFTRGEIPCRVPAGSCPWTPAGGRGSASTGLRQSSEERGGSDAGRGDHPGGHGRGRGRVHRDGFRHGRRHTRRKPAEDVLALFHNEESRQGHRPRA